MPVLILLVLHGLNFVTAFLFSIPHMPLHACPWNCLAVPALQCGWQLTCLVNHSQWCCSWHLVLSCARVIAQSHPDWHGSLCPSSATLCHF